jgi:hypothetical protein
MNWPFLRRQESPIEQLRRSQSAMGDAVQYCPTPFGIARKMLELAETGPQDVLYDLGSGDGRIPILAAQEFGCRAVGIEANEELYRYSSERVIELKLQEQVRLENGSFFDCNLSAATIVTLYLLRAINGHLQQRLGSHLRAGSRVVSLDFEIPGWKPERTATTLSEESVEYTLFLYRRAQAGSLWVNSVGEGSR